MYCFDVTSQTTPQLLNNGVGESSGAGCYANGKYFMMSQFVMGGKVYANSLYTYDAETWSQINFADLPTNLIATSITYNPADCKIYGCFTEGSGYSFGVLNADNGSVITICTLANPLVAVAASADGTVYAITEEGTLITVNTTEGSAKTIGATGLTPNGLQDACFDYASNQLFWVAYGDACKGIYSVNTSTGAATKVGEWSGSAPQFVGVFSKSTTSAVVNSDPSYVDDFKLDFDKASLTGNVVFTMPVVDYDGQNLVGNLSYSVEVDEVETATGKSEPGQLVSVPLTVTEGVHKFAARALNDAGKGPISYIQRYIGNDTPKQPEKFGANKDPETEVVTLIWNAVTEGVNGGYVNPEGIAYRIVRYPDEALVIENTKQTSCIDEVPVTNIGTYYYSITAYNGVKESEALNSNQVALGTTDPIVPPYNRKFNDGTGLAYYTVLDANKDGVTWTEDEKHVFYMKPENSTDGDDWLFAPAFRLEGGKMYRLTGSLMSPNPNFYETFEICYGTAPTAEAMTEVVVEKQQVNETFYLDQRITPAEDGVYFVGFHAMSPTPWALYIMEFAVGGAESIEGPDAVTCKVVAAPKGGMSTTVYFTCPTKTISGKDLKEITEAEVVNITTGLTVATIKNPTIGGSYEVVDNNPVEGENEYTITCNNNDGTGRGETCWCWVGIDIPSAPQNIKWRQEGDQAFIAWDEPVDIGMHGGYVDLTDIKYIIYNLNTYEKIATEWTGRTYTDTPVITAQQESLSYGVYSQNSKGVGGGYSSNFSPFGSPYVLPYNDSFANTRLQTSPWILDRIVGSNCIWSLANGGSSPVLPAEDLDGGNLCYTALGNGAARIGSPLVDIQYMASPLLTFWASIPDEISTLKIQVTRDPGFEGWKDVEIIKSKGSGWHEYSLNLTEYTDWERFQFGFTAYSTSASNQEILVDHVSITNDVDYDLAVTSLELPKTIRVGDQVKLGVEVSNLGKSEMKGYDIEVYIDDVLVDSKEGLNIYVGAANTTYFTLPTFRSVGEAKIEARVICKGDQGERNNVKTLTVKVKDSGYPEPVDLAATVDGRNVHLTWDAPFGVACEERTEDCEEFESWSVGGIECNFDDNLEPFGEIVDEGYIGDFKVIDNDHRYTQYMASGMTLEYPHRGQGMACQVFSVKEYGFSSSSIIGAHSGDKMLVFWASPVQNDDYLIFPELAENDHRISFWAKSASNKYGLESFEIMTSSTGDNREDFNSFVSVKDVPTGYNTDDESGYTFYDFELPDDARYVAIHYNAKDVLALFVDDISFTSAAGIDVENTGYNVYRNYEKLNKDIVKGFEYDDILPADGSYIYNVTTVYPKGESGFSNDAVVSLENGIRSLATSDYLVLSEEGAIVINDADANKGGVNNVQNTSASISIYASNGQRIRSLRSSGTLRIPVTPGTYLVKINDIVTPVVVR